MADSITSRTVFYDNRNGQIRFHDWNLVNTTLGTMQEPRQLIEIRGNRSGQLNLSDQCAKITDMVPADLRGIEILLSDKKKKTIGGNQVPTSYAF